MAVLPDSRPDDDPRSGSVPSCPPEVEVRRSARRRRTVSAYRDGGRIVVLSYQSLEDRLIKRAFAEATASTAPAGLPVELPEHAPRFRLLVKGAELASDEERARNSRAIPVRLRAAERVREAR